VYKPLQKLPKGQFDPHKMIKIETRKLVKSKMQNLIEMCCKKQLPMMFQTTQAQQLLACTKETVEEKVAELVIKLTEREKQGYKEVINYDF
jgi:hypothetical protein